MVSRTGSNQFSKRLRLRKEKFKGASERMLKDAATAALRVMATNTPVDTSRALSNWLVTRDGPSRDYIEAHTPGERGSTASMSLADTLALGRAEIEMFDMSRDADLFITNNTPYLRYNNGSTLTLLGQQAAKSALVGAKLFS